MLTYKFQDRPMKTLTTLKHIPSGICNDNQAISYCRSHKISRKGKKMMIKNSTGKSKEKKKEKRKNK